jgi:hypothetical protein
MFTTKLTNVSQTHFYTALLILLSVTHKVLVGKPEGKRPLGRPRLRWEDNIKMDLQEVRDGCGDWKIGRASCRERFQFYSCM